MGLKVTYCPDDFISNRQKQLTDSKDIYRYIHGGQGIVTLVAPSGKSHSYQFSRPRNSEEFPDDVIFVYAIHELTRFYLGMIELDKFRLTRNSRFQSDTEIVKGAKFIVNMANNQAVASTTPMKLYHNGTCCKCGKKLSSRKAMLLGIGRKCMNKLNEVS